MNDLLRDPWAQATFLTAASIGSALLSTSGEVGLIAAGSLNAAAGVVGNLVASHIQNNKDSTSPIDDLVESGNLSTRIASILEAIIVDEILSDNDEETRDVARLTKEYWSKLHSDFLGSGGNGQLPPDQFVSQLLNPSDPLVLMSEWLSILIRCTTNSNWIIGEMRLNQLAGALTRKFPTKLNHSFFTQGNHGSSGHDEILLRLLDQMVESIRKSGQSSDESSSAVARVEMLITGFATTAEQTQAKLSDTANKLLEGLKEFRLEIQTGIATLMGGQNEILAAVSAVASNLKTPEQGYISALKTVAAIHDITIEQLKIVLVAYATQIPPQTRLSKPGIQAVLAAGEFDRAEMLAIEWSEYLKATRMESEESIRDSKKEESEAFRFAGVAAMQKDDKESSLLHFKKSLELINRDIDREEWITTKEGIAACFLGLSQPNSAFPILIEIRQALNDFGIVTPKRLFSNSYTIGLAFSQLGDLVQAEKWLSTAFHIAQLEFRRDDPFLAASLYSLSVLAMDKEDFPRAEDIARKALGLLQEVNRIDTWHAIPGFYNLGKIERLSGKYSNSEEHHIHALSLAGRFLHETHGQRGLSFNELGLVHLNQNRSKEAEQDFKMAIGLEEAAGRGDDLFVSDYAANLGRLYLGIRQWADAKQYLWLAVDIRTKKLGLSHQKTTEVKSLYNKYSRLC